MIRAIVMPGWSDAIWARGPWLLMEAAMVFVVATFIFDVIHYVLHQMMDSRWTWLRRLGRLHQAHHEFCDKGLRYHDDKAGSNLLQHVLPEYSTQMVICRPESPGPGPASGHRGHNLFHGLVCRGIVYAWHR